MKSMQRNEVKGEKKEETLKVPGGEDWRTFSLLIDFVEMRFSGMAFGSRSWRRVGANAIGLPAAVPFIQPN